jgi:predicted phage terminase large subunit-like protein
LRLFELLFPVLFTPEVIRQAKKDLGTYDFAGQHQQRPSPAEGGMFKRTYFQRYRREELPACQFVVITVDCTFKKVDDADFVAIHVYAVVGPRYYMLARRHERMGFRATKDTVRMLWDQYKPVATLIEDKANGSAVIEALSAEVPGVIAINPEGGKEARAWAAQPTVEAGAMFLPDAGVLPGDNGLDGAEEVINEAAEFPNGKHDDDVDAMTQFINWVRVNHDFSTWAALGR